MRRDEGYLKKIEETHSLLISFSLALTALFSAAIQT